MMTNKTATSQNYKAMWEQDRAMFLQAVADLNLHATATPEMIANRIRALKAERDAARIQLVQARDLVSACDVPHKLARMKRLFKCANRQKRAAQRERNAAQARSGAKSYHIETLQNEIAQLHEIGDTE